MAAPGHAATGTAPVRHDADGAEDRGRGQAGIALPCGSRIASFPSPAATIAPPIVRNRALVPPDILAAMSPAWDRRTHPAGEVVAHALHDVVVAREGLVFDRAGHLFADSVTQHSPEEIDAARAAIAAAPPPATAGRFVLCKKRGAGNYGHWVIEMLPLAHLSSRLPDAGDLRFLVPAAGGALDAVIADSLRLLGIPPDRIAPLDDAPRRFEHLVLFTGLTAHGRAMSPLVLDAIDRLADGIAPGPARPVYLSRAGTGFRQFANEALLVAIARDAGFAIADTGTMPLDAQVALLRGATRVAGVMGAAMTNIVFARPGTPVATFAPLGMPDTFFWFLAGLRGLRYWEIRCRPAGDRRGPSPWDTDLAMSPGEFRAILTAERWPE